MCTYHFLKKKKSGMELWQWHCRIPFHFSQFQKFFFTPYFGNAIAANFFFFFFSSHFRQWHCQNCHFFFPSFGFSCAHSHFEHPPRQQVWAEGIAAIPLLKIKNFSLLLFIFLSPTFVQFRQWYCRNSLSFLRLLNKLKQYL